MVNAKGSLSRLKPNKITYQNIDEEMKISRNYSQNKHENWCFYCFKVVYESNKKSSKHVKIPRFSFRNQHTDIQYHCLQIENYNLDYMCSTIFFKRPNEICHTNKYNVCVTSFFLLLLRTTRCSSTHSGTK